MTKSEYDFCVSVYKEVVETQILDTFKLKKAANIIMGKPEYELIAINRARQIIYGWYTYHRQSFLNEFESLLNDTDKTESSTPPVEPPKDEQSHNEEVGYVGVALTQTEQEIAHLASKLNNLEDVPGNKKERTVLKRKITLLKKKL